MGSASPIVSPRKLLTAALEDEGANSRIACTILNSTKRCDRIEMRLKRKFPF